MAENNEGQTADGQTEEATSTPAQNTDTNQSVASPTPQGNDDKLSRLQAEFDRLRERNEALEQSFRIQQKFFESRQQPEQEQQTQNWSQDLELLDKALDPVLQRRFGAALNPLAQAYQSLREDNDAIRFESFLSRNNPEVLEDEDSYGKIVQQVEAVRQAARQRGIEVSRIDAFVFNEGLQGTKQKITQRKQKRTQASSQEARRQSETQAATGTSVNSEPRLTAGAKMQAIREKANRGERLTPEERNQFKEFVSNVEF